VQRVFDFRVVSKAGAAAMQHAPALAEMVFFVRNTFIDCEGTVGNLLLADEEGPGLYGLLVRKARSLPTSMLEVSSSSPVEWEPASKPEIPRQASSDSLASTCISEGNLPRGRCDSGLSQESLWDDLLAAEDGKPTRAEQGSPHRAEEDEAPPAPPRAVRGEWSIGASGHAMQQCTPCAFLDSRKGCLRGSACTYCHLCEPGEKKRRVKAQKQAQMEQRQRRMMMAAMRCGAQ